MSINYNELYEKILKNDEIPSVKKAALIRMLKYYASFKSEQDAKERTKINTGAKIIFFIR